MTRHLRYFEAIREATEQSMALDPSVFVMGLGVPDPKGIFGTTLGLQDRFGPQRVMDMPLSENAMTGVCVGAALAGMRPIITHQRIDFALVAMEQLVNQAAKWHYMFNGQRSIPLVVRMIVGRGWGQGPQHSQSLQASFAHIPGLKVLMPTTAHDAKGLLCAAIADNNPVVYIEHRWLHSITGEVPAEHYTVPIGQARCARPGSDVTIAAVSYMVLEALRAAEELQAQGIHAEVLDLRSIQPWDQAAVLASVRKTGRLVVADTGTLAFGVGAEILSCVSEQAFGALRAAPQRVALPDHPCPTSPALAADYYPRSAQVCAAVLRTLGRTPAPADTAPFPGSQRLDVPDPSFQGPF